MSEDIYTRPPDVDDEVMDPIVYGPPVTEEESNPSVALTPVVSDARPLPAYGAGGHFTAVAPTYDTREALRAMRLVRDWNKSLDSLAAGMLAWLTTTVSEQGATPDEQREVINAVAGRFQVIFTDYIQGRFQQPGADGPLKPSVHDVA